MAPMAGGGNRGGDSRLDHRHHHTSGASRSDDDDDEGDAENTVNTRRFRNHSLYDYGMGSSLQSLRGDSLSRVNVLI